MFKVNSRLVQYFLIMYVFWRLLENTEAKKKFSKFSKFLKIV